MFKKSRRKIVISIMSVLVFLLVGTLGVIYISSYTEMKNQNKQMLKTHSDMYILMQSEEKFEQPIIDKPDEKKPGFDPGSAESPMFKLSTFYTVAISDDDKILEIKNSQQSVHSNSELEKLAREINSKKTEFGTVNNLAFYKANKSGYTLVSFMDNTVVNENAMTLFRYTLIFGGAALIIFFFLSVYLARKIVNPLEESYQKQKQFISDAGHELKTPVSVVSANADLLSREIGENPWLVNIKYENERMGLLVTQLLELARTENIEPQKEHIDFSRLVEGEVLPFESVAFENRLNLNSNIERDISVNGNSTQLKQLVSILLDNAIQHSKGSCAINLNLISEHNHAKLSVINKGDAISKDQRDKIFERFYRMDESRNGEDNHYGLGLAIAKAIVTSHKGSICVNCYDGLVEFKVKIPKL